MARSRRILRMTRPRQVRGAEWRRLRREYGKDVREFNRQGRAALKAARDQLQQYQRDLNQRRREDDKRARADLRILQKAKLFQPPRSAYRTIATKRGPRRLLKRSYLRRSPKLKAAIAQHQNVIAAAEDVAAAEGAATIRARLQERLLNVFPNARNYPGAFDTLIQYSSPEFLRQIDSLSDTDLNIWIRTPTEHEQHMEIFAEMIGEEPAQVHAAHPLHYKRKRTIVGLRV